MRRADLLEKTLRLGKIKGRRREAGEDEIEDEIDSITDSIDMDVSKLQEIVEDRGAWGAAVHGIAKSWA